MSLPDNVRVLLEGPNVAHMATVLPTGAPHSVPVWVGLEDEKIVFPTSPGSRKARNLAGDPRVRIEGDAAWVIIDRISYKYIGQPYPLRTDRVVYLVEPKHAWGEAF